MPKYLTEFSAKTLITQLESKGLSTDKNLGDFVIGLQQENEPPLYLKVLVGLGALIASICFIGFLYEAGIINISNETGMAIWGLIFIASAIGLQKVDANDNTVKHSIIIQSSFTSMVVGKTLFVVSLGEMAHSGWGVTLALAIVTAITYHTYRMSIDRILSALAVLVSIQANIMWDPNVAGSREVLLNGFFLFQSVCAAILLTHGRISRNYIPLSYAFFFSLCASVLFLASHAEVGYWKEKEVIEPTFINFVLTGGLIALFGWIANGIEKLKSEPLILASAGAVLLGIISAPGILFTIGAMILGYAKHERPLIITGALLMPVFIFQFYYNLDISLLYKSGILFGSGAVLLAGRFYLIYRGWDKEDASCVQKQ
jgi:hypothetical protein